MIYPAQFLGKPRANKFTDAMAQSVMHCCGFCALPETQPQPQKEAA